MESNHSILSAAVKDIYKLVVFSPLVDLYKFTICVEALLYLPH